jgi:hypothetical protein
MVYYSKPEQRAAYLKWINALKVGDEVAVSVGGFGPERYEICKVAKISPTRRFSVPVPFHGVVVYDPAGDSRGDSRVRGMEPVTDEVRLANRLFEARGELQGLAHDLMRRDKIPDKWLLKFHDLYREYQKASKS